MTANLTKRVNVNGAMKKLQKTKLAIIRAGKGTIGDLGRLGQAHAKLIAPKHTGKLVSLIKLFQGTNSEGPYATIVSQNPTANDGHARSPQRPNFNLVKWMHATKGVFRSDNPWGKAGTKHITSGSPTYMYRTKDWLKTKVKVMAKANFNKINLK